MVLYKQYITLEKIKREDNYKHNEKEKVQMSVDNKLHNTNEIVLTEGGHIIELYCSRIEDIGCEDAVFAILIFSLLIEYSLGLSTHSISFIDLFIDFTAPVCEV